MAHANHDSALFDSNYVTVKDQHSECTNNCRENESLPLLALATYIWMDDMFILGTIVRSEVRRILIVLQKSDHLYHVHTCTLRLSIIHGSYDCHPKMLSQGYC